MSTVTSPASVDRELTAIVGEKNVAHTDFEINGVVPAAVVSPGSPEEVGAVLRLANERDLVVGPAGGLTKQQIGCVPERIDILLSTARLNKVEEYDPGDLTIAVQAGMPFAAMQRTLGEHHQWVPCDAAHLEHATIGGLLATGAAGPLKSTFGHMRDFCIGVQFATADGKVVKGGGRVVKNVAGYDLMKLLTGSYGSLAVITRGNFKVFPRPRQTRTFICSFHSLEEALQFRTRLFQSPLTPMCMEIISPGASEYLRNQGTVRDPDHYSPEQPVSLPAVEWQILLRATGSDNILGRYARELGSAVTRTLEGAAEAEFWGWISHFEESVLARHRNAMVLYT